MVGYWDNGETLHTDQQTLSIQSTEHTHSEFAEDSWPRSLRCHVEVSSLRYGLEVLVVGTHWSVAQEEGKHQFMPEKNKFVRHVVWPWWEAMTFFCCEHLRWKLKWKTGCHKTLFPLQELTHFYMNLYPLSQVLLLLTLSSTFFWDKLQEVNFDTIQEVGLNQVPGTHRGKGWWPAANCPNPWFGSVFWNHKMRPHTFVWTTKREKKGKNTVTKQNQPPLSYKLRLWKRPHYRSGSSCSKNRG